MIEQQNIAIGEAMLRLSDVVRISTLSKALIFRQIKAGTFPKPAIEGKAPLWKREDIHFWMYNLPVARSTTIGVPKVHQSRHVTLRTSARN